METLKERIKRHEGFSSAPYRCTSGAWTIGYGHFMGQGCKISKRVAKLILEEDIHQAQFEVISLGIDFLTKNRREVLVEMVFNLGLTKLLGFKKMFLAMDLRDYNTVADEMLDSLWARQVKNRAVELADIMRKG